jgi:hypothetical protein
VLRTLVAGDGFTSLLLWVVLAGAVAMFALTATLFLGSWAADGVLSMATRWVDGSCCVPCAVLHAPVVV